MFIGNVKLPERTKINPLLLPYFKSYLPQMVEGEEYLKSPYSYTVPYPLGEYTSVSRFGLDVYPPDPKHWMTAWDMVATAFRCMADSPILNKDDAFSMPERTTSAGWPWQLKYSNKGLLLDSDWFYTYYSLFLRDVLRGDFRPVFFRNFTKRELKKEADIISHLPRSVLASPSELTIMGYQLYAKQNEKIIQEPLSTPCFVGVTKFRGWWTQLARKLMKFPHLQDGDMSKFDGTIPLDSHVKLAHLRKWFCSDREYDECHDYYYTNMKNTFIVGMLGDIFAKMQGQPSGQNNTLVDNGLIHCAYWYYHWCLIVCEELPGLERTWESFEKHVCLVVMGDDVVYSYSDYVKPYMLPGVVSKTFKTLGLTFKYGSETPQTITEVEFCSMWFKPYGDDFVPVMKYEKMLATVCLKQTKNVRVMLKRFYSLRIECFWDDKIRDLLDYFIRCIKRDYMHRLVSKPSMLGDDDQTFEQIEALNWPASRIVHHYLDADG